MMHTLMIAIRRLFWVLLALGLLFFSINNRQSVVLTFEPFTFTQPVPVYLVLFAGIFLGLLVAAGVTGWLRLKSFVRRRKAERRTDYLEGQVASLAEDAHKVRAGAAHAAATDAPSGSGLAKTS